jgi:hypothetical protein
MHVAARSGIEVGVAGIVQVKPNRFMIGLVANRNPKLGSSEGRELDSVFPSHEIGIAVSVY